MQVLNLGLAFVCLILISGAGLSSVAIAQDRETRTQERTITGTTELRARERESENEPQAQSGIFDSFIPDLLDRVGRGCSAQRSIQRSIVMRCPDGSSITVEMRCEVSGGGRWPDCYETETCEQTNEASCPPAQTEPSGPR